MVFKTLQMIIDSKNPTKSDLIKIANNNQNNPIKNTQLYSEREKTYVVKKWFIENRFLWLYFNYDEGEYNENVLDISNNIIKSNPKQRTELEFRKQFFVCYDLKKSMLYLNDIDKIKLVERYINNILQKEVNIKYIYNSIEEFEDRVKCIKSLKFTQVDNLVNREEGSIFRRAINIYGLDLPDNLEISIKAKNGIINKNWLKKFKMKKDKGEIEDIVVVGKDNNNMEHIFDFSKLLSKININIEKNENNMYDDEQIKLLLLEKIR